jgi:hypothetical protein
MPEFLLVLEGRNAPHHYVLLVEDVLLRRLGARRLLRSAFVIEAGSCEDVYDRIRFYTPCDDGVLVVPFTPDHFTRNLRGAKPDWRARLDSNQRPPA